jgi:hypothetical protein
VADNDLSPQDRDMLIRTVIGEAANQPPIGQAAVAHVVLNRLNSGNYGDTASQVVLSPHQFEPWQTRTQELATIPRTSQQYQDIGKIVDGAASGDIPDPTQGATNFANVKTVQDRGNTKGMNWINSMTNQTRIGDHTFGNADGQKAINKAANIQDSQPTTALQFQDAVPDHLGALLSSSGATDNVPAVASDSTTPDHLGELLKTNSSKPLPPEGYYGGKLHINITPGVPLSTEDSSGNTVYIQPGDPRYPVANPNPSMVPQIAKDYVGRLNELAGQNASMAGEGLSDISQGNVATGSVKAGLGALGYVFSPASAIDKPIENITGNKNLGEIASLIGPGTLLGKAANAARPAVSALSDIIKDVGAENIPSIVSRLESNPKLTLMDVAPTVRGNAAGLATDPRNVPAMNQLNQFQQARMADRSGDAVNIFEDALGPTPNMAATKKELTQSIADVGKKFDPVIDKIGPVDITPVINNIDSQFPASTLNQLKQNKYEGPQLSPELSRLWEMREKLRGNWSDREQMFANAADLHKQQRDLRLKYGNSRDPGSYEARQVRREIINAIDEKSGGKYKPIQKEYKDANDVDKAFQEGFSVFSNPTSAKGAIDNHPDVWREWMNDASDTEKRAVAQGILFGANNKIMNTRRGIDVPENSYAHERIASVVGKPNADEIVRRLGDWRDIAETDNLLTKNSATAVRQAGQEARSVRDARSGHDILQSLMPAAVVGGAAHLASGGRGLLSAIAAGTAIGAGKAANYAGKAHDLASNKAYAQWASATGSKKEDLITALRAMAEKQNPGNRLSTSSILQALPR